VEGEAGKPQKTFSPIKAAGRVGKVGKTRPLQENPPKSQSQYVTVDKPNKATGIFKMKDCKTKEKDLTNIPAVALG